MLACLTTRERVLLGVVGLVVLTTAALEYGGGSDVAVFLDGSVWHITSPLKSEPASPVTSVGSPADSLTRRREAN